ncbi:helix-turn-helix domain-containing protein [Escherichia coli]
MGANETFNRWNHPKWPHMVSPCPHRVDTVAFGDFDADPMSPAQIAADILAMDKNTATEIIVGLITALVDEYQECGALENELELLKGGAIAAVRKSEEAAREMAAAREKYAPVVKRLREDGLSWNQIADMTGINRSTIRQWAK